MDTSEVAVGRVVKAHGLRGDVIVQPASAGSDVLLHVRSVSVSLPGNRGQRAIVRARTQGRGIRLALEGVTDRTAAERLVGASLLLPRDQLPPEKDDEIYVDRLIGLPVVSPAGDRLGTVTGFEDGGPQSWLVVDAGHGDALVPFAEPLVKVELEAGRIVIDAPEGLLNPAEAEDARGKP